MMSTPTPVYWATLQHNRWSLHLGATNAGLCYVGLPNETFTTLEEWAAKHVPGSILVQDTATMAPYLQELEEYLSARRNTFSVPLDLKGTAFQCEVWNSLLEIPFGETQSYSQVSSRIGRPRAVRAVASAIGDNPVPIVVPCHRVIGKNGHLTGFRGGLEMKADLLTLEGF